MTPNPLTWPTRLLDRLRQVLTPDRPSAWLTVSVGGLDADTTAEVARHVTLDLEQQVSSLQPRYEVQFAHLPDLPEGETAEDVLRRVIAQCYADLDYYGPSFDPMAQGRVMGVREVLHAAGLAPEHRPPSVPDRTDQGHPLQVADDDTPRVTITPA